jgi:glucose/arabinose dehydrogenase
MIEELDQWRRDTTGRRPYSRSTPTRGETMPSRTLRSSAVLAACAALLPACDGSDDDGNGPPPGPDPVLPDLALEPAFPDLSFGNLVLMLQAPGDDSRWFAVDKVGVIRVFENDPAVSETEVFMAIEDRVNANFAESGLLGMAFHPGFPTTPYVYVNYTTTGPSGSGFPLISRISRFATGDAGASLDAASEEILLTVPQPASNHNGGHLVFGPDGYLYAGFGDGGGAGDPGENAQDPRNVLGTILRIDVDGGSPYAIPPGNPFAGNLPCTGGVSPVATGCPEIFAFGLRNPWRFSFDRTEGTLWAGDVGQDNWEEVDIIEVGGNYGWDEREGAHCFEPPTGCNATFIEPVAEYDHGIGRAITGGYVYRGNAVPGLQGYYLFADFSTGALFTIPADEQPPLEPEIMLDTDMLFSTFAEDTAGEVYIADYGDGSLYRIIAAP